MAQSLASPTLVYARPSGRQAREDLAAPPMAANGPRTAADELVAALPRLRRFARALTGNRDDADDLLQSGCERALSRLHQWQPGTRFDSWMFRILQTIWCDRMRAHRNRGETLGEAALAKAVGDDGRAVDDRIMLARTRVAMARLPADQRVALALVSIEGLSYAEAARVLSVPIGTVMSRLSRARQRLHLLVHGPS